MIVGLLRADNGSGGNVGFLVVFRTREVSGAGLGAARGNAMSMSSLCVCFRREERSGRGRFFVFFLGSGSAMTVGKDRGGTIGGGGASSWSEMSHGSSDIWV